MMCQVLINAGICDCLKWCVVQAKRVLSLTGDKDEGSYHYLTMRTFQLMEAGGGGHVGEAQ